MKKHFLFRFHTLIYILAGIICAMLLGVVIYNSLLLGGVAGLESSNFGLDLAAIIFAIIVIAVVAIFLFVSSYTIKDEYLLYMLGFVPIKIKYKNMITIREEKTSHAMVLNYMKLAKGEENDESGTLVSGIVINISDKRKDDFVRAIRAKNSAILYEEIDMHLNSEE